MNFKISHFFGFHSNPEFTHMFFYIPHLESYKLTSIGLFFFFSQYYFSEELLGMRVGHSGQLAAARGKTPLKNGNNKMNDSKKKKNEHLVVTLSGEHKSTKALQGNMRRCHWRQ